MHRFWLLNFLFFLAVSSNAQDWIKNAVPSNLDQTCLIVEKIDSMGAKCLKGTKIVYCNNFEKNIDKQLPVLQKLQEAAFKKYNHPYVMVLPEAYPYQEFSDFKDINKYRYILKIHISPAIGEKEEDPLWMYYFYDRKTGKSYPRIHQIQDDRFKYLKDLINSLNSKFKAN